jgi:hypothetical protein
VPNPLKTCRLLLICLAIYGRLQAQCPTSQGDEVTYGTGDTWIGYIYDNIDLTSYAGYVTEGTSGNLNFDESFGGDYVNYTTNGCSVYTETFSARYKLNKTFADGNYTITAGGDDGYRFSIDGGTTWVINQYTDHPYGTTAITLHLNGAYNLVLEYYENGGGNRVSVNIQTACTGTDDESVYGTNDVWRGYVYDNADLTFFKGTVTEGTSGNSNFDETFGGDYVTYNTNACAVYTETFSVRYRLQKTFPNSNVTFLVGGDDGYRFSLDGGATWAVNQWTDHSYTTTSYTAALNGTYNMVLEYYENGGVNRVSFDLNSIVLPIQLVQFSGHSQNEQVQLNWTTSTSSNTDHFIIEKSTDGRGFQAIGQVMAATGITSSAGIPYSYTDADITAGPLFYRLKMVDANHLITYSNTIIVRNNTTGKLRIYPTIVQSNRPLLLQTGKQLNNTTIIVTDLTGRPVMQLPMPLLPAAQTTTIPLNWSQLQKGIYLVQVKNATGILLNQKIVVQ